MKTYRIHANGADMGVYQAWSKEGAIEEMRHDAGDKDCAHAAQTLGDTVEQEDAELDVAEVWDVNDWLRDGDDDITAETTNDELAESAAQYEDQAAEQRAELKGSVLDLLTAQRDALRDSAKAAG
jgi:hypothetical protein